MPYRGSAAGCRGAAELDTAQSAPPAARNRNRTRARCAMVAERGPKPDRRRRLLTYTPAPAAQSRLMCRVPHRGRDGGTGRRAGLKIQYWKQCASSSLAPGTNSWSHMTIGHLAVRHRGKHRLAYRETRCARFAPRPRTHTTGDSVIHHQDTVPVGDQLARNRGPDDAGRTGDDAEPFPVHRRHAAAGGANRPR